MNSSAHIDNKGNNILISGVGPTQGLGEHSLTAEKMYSINFTETKKKFWAYTIIEQVLTYLLMVQKL